MERAKKAQKRNLQVEALRGILILMVVFFHYAYQLQNVYGVETVSFPTLADWGKCAVGGFFIMMGFFALPKVLEKYRFWPYILKRIVRIMTAYVLAVTIIFIFMKIFGLPGKNFTFVQYLLNLPLLNSFFGKPYVDGAHWFVLDSLILYLDLAIILKTKLSPRVYLPAWLILENALGLLMKKWGFLSPVYKLIGGSYVEFFIIGVAIVAWMREYAKAKGYAKYLNIYMLCIAVAVVEVFIKVHLAVGIFTIVFIGIFALALAGRLKALDKVRGLIFIGEVSYPLYLIHQNIGYQILIATSGAWEGNVAGCLTAIVGVTIVMIGAGYLIHRYWEVPVIPYLTKKIKG